MSIRQTYFDFQLAEARGHLPEGTSPAQLTIATAIEAGVQAFHQAYYGDGPFAEVLSECRANREAAELVGRIQEAILSDIRPIYRLQETHVTSDFPLVLANIRDRVTRRTFSPIESAIFAVATEREVSDFKPIKGIRYSTIDRLKLRPEGTDVSYATLGQTDDNYVVSNFEKALGYTWEAYVNDDLSIFTNGMAELGNAARRNRIFVVFEAIAAGLTAAQYGGSAGGPEVARLKAVLQAIAQTKNKDNNVVGLRGSHMIISVQHEEEAISTLTSDFIQAANGSTTKNTMKGRVEYSVERLLARILGNDWIVYDDQVKWLEIAYLKGFKAGPKTYTKAPDTLENLDEGTFKNHTFDVKVGDVVAAKVVEQDGVKRVAG